MASAKAPGAGHGDAGTTGAAEGDGGNQLTTAAPDGAGRTAATYDIATAVFDDFVIQPQNYDLRLHPQESLVGGNAEENAEIALRLLAGETGIDRDGEIVHPVLAALHDAVVLNAGAALSIYGTVETIHEGVAAARRAIEEGRVMETLERVVEVTHRGGAGL
ncbi:MAG: hypothetical protein ACOCYQ_02430 [Alkalispirochaeta sp.]